MLEERVRTTEAFVLGRLAVTPAWQTATSAMQQSHHFHNYHMTRSNTIFIMILLYQPALQS